MLASNEAGGHRLKDDKDAGLAEAVHRSVSAGARGQGPAGGAPAGLHDPAPLLPCSPVPLHVVTGQHPCPEHHLVAISIGGPVAVLPIECACRGTGEGQGHPGLAEPASTAWPHRLRPL